MTTTADRAANIEQARAFVAALSGHVDRCSAKIEDVESRSAALQNEGKLRSVATLVSEAKVLREELYDIHRHIDRLHDAFPELLSRPHR